MNLKIEIKWKQPKTEGFILYGFNKHKYNIFKTGKSIKMEPKLGVPTTKGLRNDCLMDTEYF